MSRANVASEGNAVNSTHCVKIPNTIHRYQQRGQLNVGLACYDTGSELLFCSKIGVFVKIPIQYILVESVSECNVYCVIVVQFVLFPQFVHGKVNECSVVHDAAGKFTR